MLFFLRLNIPLVKFTLSENKLLLEPTDSSGLPSAMFTRRAGLEARQEYIIIWVTSGGQLWECTFAAMRREWPHRTITASSSVLPVSRNRRKLTRLYLHVSKALNITSASFSECSVNNPSDVRLYFAKLLAACSALLLFHGTPSKSKNVNSLSPYFLNRFWY